MSAAEQRQALARVRAGEDRGTVAAAYGVTRGTINKLWARAGSDPGAAPKGGPRVFTKKPWNPKHLPPLALLASLGGRLRVLAGQLDEFEQDCPPGVPLWRFPLLKRSVDELRTVHRELATKMGGEIVAKKSESAPAPTPPPTDWVLRELRTWVHRDVGSVGLTLESPSAGALAADEAAAEFSRFEARWKDEAKQLPEFWDARKARKDLDDAQQRREEVRQKLVAVEEQTLDLSAGALGRLAERRSSLEAQGKLLDARLPKLAEALAGARKAFSTAAGELRTRLRAEHLAAAVRRRDEAAAELAAGGRLGALLAAGLLGDALAVAGSRDSTAAEALALAEVPAVEQRGPTPAPPAVNPFAVPVWASPPPEFPRPAVTSTPAPPVTPPRPQEGWAAVTPEQAEKAKADQEKQRLVAEHAAAQRARQAAEAASAAAQEDLA
jgi:hypothetical protein